MEILRPGRHRYEQELRWQTERQKMIAELRQLISSQGMLHVDELIYQAFEEVPRHKFVGKLSRPLAYKNQPLDNLPGSGLVTTLSSPEIVAIMTSLLSITSLVRSEEKFKVWELGSGLGFQSVILANILGKRLGSDGYEIISTEIIPRVIQKADKHIAHFPDAKVTILPVTKENPIPFEDNFFDRIIITAAVHLKKESTAHLEELAQNDDPQLLACYKELVLEATLPYSQKLKNQSTLVVPIGNEVSQLLTVIRKGPDGRSHAAFITECTFVPVV